MVDLPVFRKSNNKIGRPEKINIFHSRSRQASETKTTTKL
jgi:hypothetical protein